jgi:cell division inhibitor SulA
MGSGLKAQRVPALDAAVQMHVIEVVDRARFVGARALRVRWMRDDKTQRESKRSLPRAAAKMERCDLGMTSDGISACLEVQGSQPFVPSSGQEQQSMLLAKQLYACSRNQHIEFLKTRR